MKIFTLAPVDHPTDPKILEHSYKLWSTYKVEKDAYYVRGNDAETAGGQRWHVIAEKAKTPSGNVWVIKRGNGFLAQGGALLARLFASKRMKFRSEVPPWPSKVVQYKATAKVYSLPSLLNGGVAVVSRDKQADIRSAQRKRGLADLMAEWEKRKG